jgi:hypothetical protein
LIFYYYFIFRPRHAHKTCYSRWTPLCNSTDRFIKVQRTCFVIFSVKFCLLFLTLKTFFFFGLCSILIIIFSNYHRPSPLKPFSRPAVDKPIRSRYSQLPPPSPLRSTSSGKSFSISGTSIKSSISGQTTTSGLMTPSKIASPVRTSASSSKNTPSRLR